MAVNALPAIAKRNIVPGRDCVIRVQVRLVQAPAMGPVREDVDVAAQRARGQAERGVEGRRVGTGLEVGVVENETPDVGAVVLVVEAVLGARSALDQRGRLRAVLDGRDGGDRLGRSGPTC